MGSHPSFSSRLQDLRLRVRDREIDQTVAYTGGVCQGDCQAILFRHTVELRMAVLDHRYGEQIPARGVLHQDEGVRQLERPGKGLDDLGRRQLVRDSAVTEAIQPELQVLQL